MASMCKGNPEGYPIKINELDQGAGRIENNGKIFTAGLFCA
jgi:hypothetical protein